MDYADADYKDLYVEGPMGYRKLSENKANDKKNQSNESGLWIKELKNIVNEQVFSKVLISGVYRPFFILACPPKIFVPISQGHVSKRFPEEKKILKPEACRSTEI